MPPECATSLYSVESQPYLDLHNKICSRSFNSRVVQALGELVSKLSERVLPTLIPILSDGLATGGGDDIGDEQERERSRFRLPYGGKLLVKDGQEVGAGTILIEWDPYTMPIITEMNGVANFVDLTEGVSIREITDDATGISSNEVVDWKQAAGGSNLRPRITLRDDKGEVLTLTNGLEARYFLSASSILSVENGAKVQAGDVLARIPRESSKTRDITEIGRAHV